MKIPSSIDMARELIKDNPTLFNQEDDKCLLLLSKALNDHSLEVIRWLKNEEHNEIRERLKVLSTIKK